MITDIPANLFTKLLYISSTTKELKTYDLILATLGIEYNALILTFDKMIRKKIKGIYSVVYYCSSQGNMANDSPLFAKNFKERTKGF